MLRIGIKSIHVNRFAIRRFYLRFRHIFDSLKEQIVHLPNHESIRESNRESYDFENSASINYNGKGQNRGGRDRGDFLFKLK